MPTEHIVALLVAERDKLNRAIEALQGPLKRRGRPPKNPLAAAASAGTKTRRHRTAAQRKAQAKRMRAYWAKRKKQEKKSRASARGQAPLRTAPLHTEV